MKIVFNNNFIKFLFWLFINGNLWFFIYFLIILTGEVSSLSNDGQFVYTPSIEFVLIRNYIICCLSIMAACYAIFKMYKSLVCSPMIKIIYCILSIFMGFAAIYLFAEYIYPLIKLVLAFVFTPSRYMAPM